MILVDTGPLVAAALHGDDNHRRCVEFFTASHLNAEPLLVPSLVVTEVCYLLAREAGARVEAEFLRSLAARDFQLIEPTSPDLDRAAYLVITYAGFPLGAVDANRYRSRRTPRDNRDRYPRPPPLHRRPPPATPTLSPSAQTDRRRTPARHYGMSSI